MNESLQALVARFIEDRDAIRAAFKLENDYIYPVCAQIFLAADRPVERERVEACKALVKSTTGVFSNFRGNIKLPLLLALAALLLSDTVSEDGFPALGARGRDLFKRMRKEHPFLTGREDSVFALLLAQSDRSDDELIEDMERCYDLLREHFPGGDGLQTASHVLALSTEDPTDKAFRVVSLYNAIEAAGGKYGKTRQLPILAALTLGQRFAEDLARDILELDGFLATQKGYKGVFGMDKRTRIMHAAMLLSLSDQSSGQRATVNAAAGTWT